MFFRFSVFVPLVFIDLFNLGGVGADRHYGVLGSSSRWEAAEKCARLQLCILVSTLFSPHQTRFYPERLPIIYVAHVVCWTPSRQPAIEGEHATKHVITGQVWQGSRENYGVRHCFDRLKFF